MHLMRSSFALPRERETCAETIRPSGQEGEVPTSTRRPALVVLPRRRHAEHPPQRPLRPWRLYPAAGASAPLCAPHHPPHEPHQLPPPRLLPPPAAPHELRLARVLVGHSPRERLVLCVGQARQREAVLGDDFVGGAEVAAEECGEEKARGGGGEGAAEEGGDGGGKMRGGDASGREVEAGSGLEGAELVDDPVSAGSVYVGHGMV